MGSVLNYPVPAYQATFSTVSTYSAEQAVLVSSAVSVNTPQSGVALRATGSFTAGTNGVTVKYQIRKGTGTSGNLPTYGGATGLLTCVATDLYGFVVEGYDLPGNVQGQVYQLTVTVGSASAASVVADVLFTAIVTGSS